jgi:hypothetical protein
MKSSIRTMFVVLAVLMSFTIVQAQIQTQEGHDTCSVVVEGTVTEITETGAITVDGTIDYNINNNDEPVSDPAITVYGVPLDKKIVAKDDEVVINVNMTNDGNFIACYLTVTKIENGVPVVYDIVLRPRYIEN